MQRNGTSAGAERELAIAYTDKPISGWGGLISVFCFFDGFGVTPVTHGARAGIARWPHVSDQIPVVDMVLALFATVLTGGRRFAHAERLRSDAGCKPSWRPRGSRRRGR